MNQKELLVYESNQRIKKGWIGTWVEIFKNIVKSRDLIFVLYRRDLLSGYKKSWLGWAWLFISPLIGVASWVIMNATGILNPGDVGIDYPVYVLLGSSIWGLFMGFYSSAGATLGAGSEFITQIKYPHESMLFKQTALHVTNFLITFVLNIIILFATQNTPNIAILLFPLLVLPLFFLGAAMGLVISVISVVASDISNFFNLFLSFVFYVTPIVYSTSTSSPFLNQAVQYNPLTYLVGGVRDMIIHGKMDRPDLFLAFGIASFILFLLALRLFYVSEDRIVERMI